MIPETIEYILSLRESEGLDGIHNRLYQVAIPNFPPTTSLTYSVGITPNVHSFILYDFQFGEAMMPHAFDVKITVAGQKIFDAIITGRFTTGSFYSFITVEQGKTIDFAVTNLRLLFNYYESGVAYVVIPDQQSYGAMIAALKRKGVGISGAPSRLGSRR